MRRITRGLWPEGVHVARAAWAVLLDLPTGVWLQASIHEVTAIGGKSRVIGDVLLLAGVFAVSAATPGVDPLLLLGTG